METEAELSPARTRRLDLRVTETERRQIAQNAERAGLKLSAYLRRSALGSPVSDAEISAPLSAILTKPERAQLASMANNLNQLTRHAHTGQLDEFLLTALLHQIKALLV